MADIIVVGAGAAGLFAALTAAEKGASVTLVSARPLAETASYWAQGGAAAALAVDDSPAIHLQDTLAAGRGLTRPSAAEVLTEEAAARVRELQALGVIFDADRHGELALGLEGGHSRRRIIHAGGSATGRRILRQLSADVAADPRIEVLEGRRAAGILRDGEGRAVGLTLEGGGTLTARATILATGGAAALWSRTTNPPGSFGSGLLLARHAGAALADLEFTQFHPTAVVGIQGREGFLISEAVRGEGATLHGPDGERFVDELSPRDAVARAIFRLLRQTGAPAAYLDMRMVDPGRFPNVVSALREAGLDPMTQRVPVAPASHYVMGGIVTDLDGRADGVEGLYAVGECACTGLHGANRLASNSLSECFVFGRRAALAGLDEPEPPSVTAVPPPETVAPPPTRDTRKAVWRLAGLERSAEGLNELRDDPHPLARLVAASALAREETRGAHARAEFPETDPSLDGRHTVFPAGSETPAFVPWL
ncbi:L-aspartate oxidase [Candidatus Solirubrobacter pratensis]|uniref:L-aspartate oxidase n=1 Tax=Candidatus Solirubrobacter pratensis TaxID=1298857 RepID=UPI000413F0D1|nr:FAD-dependent oxidoreductase [Candidatus Solirubrobacter pratensis]